MKCRPIVTGSSVVSIFLAPVMVPSLRGNIQKRVNMYVYILFIMYVYYNYIVFYLLKIIKNIYIKDVIKYIYMYVCIYIHKKFDSKTCFL